MWTTTLAGLALATQHFALAAPAPVSSAAERNPLTKRNVCDGKDATPVLYKEYGSDECPPVNVMKDDGVCPNQNYLDGDCVSFCQVRTTFTYHTEAPISNSYCHGPFTCTITDTKTETITKDLKFNGGWSKGFQIGVTGGFSWADANAKARAFQIKLEKGECGYFTIVPVFADVCGTVTQGKEFVQAGGIGYWECRPKETLGNICASKQRMNGDGTVDSETIFVRTDCGTREPLDHDQDPIYQKPGVPMDRGQYELMAAGWANVGEASQFPEYSQPKCGDHGYTMPVADVENVNKELDGKGDQQCCTPDIGGCTNIGVSGGMAVDVCAPDGQKLCVSCARLANYVAGLETGCVQDGKVGGTQDIVETPGMTVQI